MLKIATKTNDDSGVVKVAYEQRKRPAARVYIYYIYVMLRPCRTYVSCLHCNWGRQSASSPNHCSSDRCCNRHSFTASFPLSGLIVPRGLLVVPQWRCLRNPRQREKSVEYHIFMFYQKFVVCIDHTTVGWLCMGFAHLVALSRYLEIIFLVMRHTGIELLT